MTLIGPRNLSADTAKQTFFKRARESKIGLKKINQSVTMKSDRTSAGKEIEE